MDNMALWFGPISISFANPSWHWLTGYMPWYVLPFTAAETIIIEALVICIVNRLRAVKTALLVFIIVGLANLVSFYLPYLYNYVSIAGFSLAAHESLPHMMDEYPRYIVDLGFLFLTVISEIPIVLLVLWKKVESEIRLLISILAANIVTTGLVYITEHIYKPFGW